MVEVLAWFAVGRPAPGRGRHWRQRSRAAFARRGGDGGRTEFGGADWGITVRHQPAPWLGCAAGEGRLAVSLGLPVGLDVTGGALGVARRLAAGADLAAEVVPPFAMIARDVDGTVRVAQDWLGMARLYVGTRDGVLAFADRSTVLADFLGGAPEADPWAWAGVAASGHFGGDDAPVRGVRLLHPGARVTLRPPPRADAGTAPWRATWRVGRTADDLVRAGLDSRGDPDRAAAAVLAGMDAARAAAAVVLGTTPPGPRTLSAPPDLRAATTRLLHRHDLHLPGGDLADAAAPPPPLVACGPRAPRSWYPDDPDRFGDRAAVARALTARHLAAGSALAPRVAAARQEYLADRLRHAATLGLAGTDLADYVYLTERLRRASPAPDAVHVALSPAAVVASYAIPATLARGRLAAVLPGDSPAPRRPGDRAVADAARALLAEAGDGGLAGLLRPDAVRAALAPRAGDGGRAARRYLHLALADALVAGGRRDWVALDRDPAADRPPPGSRSRAPGRMDGQDMRR